MPSLDNVEEYIASVEEYFFSSVSAVSRGFPDVHEAMNQLWVDISRYGPGMPAFPDVHIPTLGDFQVPPPPPPPPPMPTSLLEQSAAWIERHPWKTSGIVVGAVGAGLLVGYRGFWFKRRHVYATSNKTSSVERRQIVVVLGGDSLYASPLISDLEKKGYIVIASVSTPEAVDALESKCNGYVKAHVLDPFEPAMIPVFLRSLLATLSRKFPVNTAGDPFASPSSLPYIHSVISFLTLSANVPFINAPLEHISFQDKYIPYLTATQITPLQVIQSLLPLLRTGPARSRDKGKKSIIVCLPATDTRVGLPFASIQSMAAASTLRAVEVLRREIDISGMTDKSESMQNIKVVVVDVGTFNVGTSESFGCLPPEGIYKAMEGWTIPEKMTYGPAFAAIMQGQRPILSRRQQIEAMFKNGHNYGFSRKPTDLSVLSNNLVAVVSGSRFGISLFGFSLQLGRNCNCIFGERFSVGAGAFTYKVASHLPSVLLDGLLNLPYFLISIRNWLLPVQPFRQPPETLPPVSKVNQENSATTEVKEESQGSASENEVNSEGDVESNSGDTVESSWISLNKKHHTDDG